MKIKCITLLLLLWSANQIEAQNSRKSRALEAASQKALESSENAAEGAALQVSEPVKTEVKKVEDTKSKVKLSSDKAKKTSKIEIPAMPLPVEEEPANDPRIVEVPTAPATINSLKAPETQVTPAKPASSSNYALGAASGIAKPKNPLEIGAHFGYQLLYGDVSSRFGFDLNNMHYGLHLRKALSHLYSLRLNYSYGEMTMRNPIVHYTAVPNGYVSNSGGGTEWYPHSKSYTHMINLDNVFTIGNNSIYRRNPKLNFNFFVGPTLLLYRTKVNLRNANNNPYDWNSINQVFNNFVGLDPVNGIQRAKSEAAKALDQMMDNTYESEGSNNGNKPKVGGFALAPGISVGAGIAVKLTEKFNLGLDQRFTYMFDDYIDGERFANFNNNVSYSQNNDILSNTTLNINYNLGGSKDEPLYWINGYNPIIDKLAENNSDDLIKNAFADFDADGVPNNLDQEENSRPECPVDTKGVMLDSDKDGILDCDDKEPYSPTGYPIDANGVAQVPPPACCDAIKNIPPPQQNPNNNACKETPLPLVMFEKNKYGITPPLEPNLKTVGEKMLACPEVKIVVSGINDRNTTNGKYNEQLSYNRAMEVVDFLSTRYGISRDRFIVKYNLDGVGDTNADRAVIFRYAQNGEFGTSNPPSPHPGLKAGMR
ncbi:MAG: OmpA family protein [Chitinophagales bacterium]|jgi:outer membrane protein OmpA-like peptidoglycan-associated protein|nr:OmpA family protein [Chitinophagales bacterium]